jgi:hypothetical protein
MSLATRTNVRTKATCSVFPPEAAIAATFRQNVRRTFERLAPAIFFRDNVIAGCPTHGVEIIDLAAPGAVLRIPKTGLHNFRSWFQRGRQFV